MWVVYGEGGRTEEGEIHPLKINPWIHTNDGSLLSEYKNVGSFQIKIKDDNNNIGEIS